MSSYRITISSRQAEKNSHGQNLVKTAHQLNLSQLQTCQAQRLIFMQGQLSNKQATEIAQTILVDPVTETFTVTELSDNSPFSPTQGIGIHNSQFTIETTLLPGVTDPAAENLLRSAHNLGFSGLERAATGQSYHLSGDGLNEATLTRLANEVFSNPVIQRHSLNQFIEPPFFAYQETDLTVEIITLREANDEKLLAISQERRLALDLKEMQAVQTYFQGEGREPSEAELEMLAQTWSEHCVHKTFKAKITYTGPQGGYGGSSTEGEASTKVIDGLLKTYLRTATEQINKPWVVSAFVDDAGIVRFDDEFDVAFKVETHNHPSALEPFGGANTGVGGVVRDVLGVSARPIANTDVLCFGPADMAQSEVPAGVLHPRRIAEGVIHGVEDYGNKMGIPTVNGSIFYHPGYTANPLVYCGCLGILPRGSHPTGVQADDLIIVIGGRTGRDGLRGATFSSMEMDVETSEIAGTAVQIGHPIHEKQVLEILLRARDEELYNAITDCGAGGLSSSVGEMGAEMGADVKLEAVPLKYPGLRPWEIWLSEAQERMVLAVPAENWPRLQEICAGQDMEAVCIGTFAPTGRLTLHYADVFVGDLEMDFLHDGIPQRELIAEWKAPMPKTTADRRPFDYAQDKPPTADFTSALLQLLAQPNIASKEDTIRRYDHEVQGGTAMKPLVGIKNHGPGDAAVIVPRDTQNAPRATVRGVALSNGLNPLYGERDPYAMAWAAIDEALRNLVAVGADPDQVAILDNFCWGNPNLPDRLGSLVRCTQGCYDAALAYQTPYISGKDSLNNEYTGADGDKHAIPGTLLISALGIVPSVEKTTTMDFKTAGNLIYLLGETKEELANSHYQLFSSQSPVSSDQSVPQPVPNALAHFRALHRVISAGLVQACHDCSEGGVAVALAEMCLAGGLGARIELSQMPEASTLANTALLFSESLSRFIIEVQPQDAEAFEKTLRGVPLTRLGHVRLSPQLDIIGQEGQSVVEAEVSALEKAWRGETLVTDEHQPSPHPSQREGNASPPLGGTEGGLMLEHNATPFSQTSPRVLILHANGTNRDRDAALACELAGGKPEIVHLNQLLNGERHLLEYGMVVVPGGFSYGDDLGAGKLFALDLHHRLGDLMQKFVDAGRPVLGICNGFQVLVKAGLIPGRDWSDKHSHPVTLTYNDSDKFECRWVYLQANPNSPSLFTAGLTEPIYCPVAHGEGRIAIADTDTEQALLAANLHALTYVNGDGSPAVYPANPNGSTANIAGLCNPAGNVFGLMPHPENHIFPWQHPRRQRGEGGMLGLRLFRNAIINN